MTDSKKLSQERYSQLTEGYVKSETHAKGYDLDRLFELADPQPEWSVLDVATGGGHTALKIAPAVKQMTVTDLTPEMLAAAEAHLTEKGITNAVYRVADAENLPLEDNTFDLVTCRIAPHHFPDAFKFVQECERVLQPGGVLIVQDHVLPDDEDAARYVDAFEKLRDPSHHRAFAEYEWRGIFLDAGLVIDHTEQLTKRHPFIQWAQRQNCSPKTITRLTVLLKQAPAPAAEWMEAHAIGTEDASFVNHHIIIKGHKPA